MAAPNLDSTFRGVDINGKGLSKEDFTTSLKSTFKVRENLFNVYSSENIIGAYIEDWGAVIPNASLNTSHFIAVKAGQTLSLSSRTATTSAFYCWFDANKAILSRQIGTFPNVTAPSNTSYLRFCVTISAVNWGSIQVELGTTKTSLKPYAKVSELVSDSEIAQRALKASSVSKGYVMEPESLSYTRGKNLFNVNDPTNSPGYFCSTLSGNFNVDSNWNTTHFMPCTTGDRITVSVKIDYSFFYTFFNEDLAYVGGMSGVYSYVTAPAGAAFLVISLSKQWDWRTLQVEIGTTPTPFEPHRYYIDKIKGAPVYLKENITLPVIAPKIYIARHRTTTIYPENLYRYYDREGRAKSNLTMTISTSEFTSRGRSYELKLGAGNNSLTAMAATLKAYNSDYVEIASIPVIFQPVNETLTTTKRVTNIGDSYTLQGFMQDQLLASSAATGLTFQGMRVRSSTGTAANHEGRGGWSMANYHTANTLLFNPFMQPQSPYKYYGNTSYWISAIANPDNTGNTNYDAGYVDSAIRALYNGTTGLLNSPAVNDVMYDNVASAYKTWNGSAWVTVTGLTWTFNFAKYRSLYGFSQVDIVHIMLGTNDFGVLLPSDFQVSYYYYDYKTRMDTVITSLKADNAAVKIIIGVPVSSGKQGEEGVFETEKRKQAYWLLAKNLYADYGNREAEGIVLADYHSQVDRVHGYARTFVKPFDQYTGSETEPFLADYIHLSADGKAQFGDVYMGAVQSLR